MATDQDSVIDLPSWVSSGSSVKPRPSSDSRRTSASQDHLTGHQALLQRISSLFISQLPVQYEYESEPRWNLDWLIARIAPKGSAQRTVLLALYYAAFLASLLLFAKFSSFSASVKGFDSSPTVSCAAQLISEGGGGLNFANANSAFYRRQALRCPAGCSSQLAWTPIRIGPGAANLVPYVVGGIEGNYRGDSWICSSAIHAGILSNERGGCLVATLIPSVPTDTFASSGENQNGIKAISFNSTYPATLKFDSLESGDDSFCQDLGFVSEALFLPLLLVLPLLNVPKRQLFWSTCTCAILYWIFVSPNTGKSDSAIRLSLASVLPAIGILYVIYANATVLALPSPSRHPFEASFLFVGLLWTGLHLDYLLNSVAPLPTLDFSAKMFQNGTASLVQLFVLLALVIAAAVMFGYMHFKQGTLLGYIGGYTTLFGVYLLMPKVIGLSVHLHHYLTGLLLIPLTRIKSRFALACQALLIGLFLQGVLKYGFASPFNTNLQVQATRTLGTTKALWALNASEISGPDATLRWLYPFNATVNMTDLDTASLIAAFNTSDVAAISRLPVTEYVVTINDVLVYRGKKSHYSIKSAIAQLGNGEGIDPALTASMNSSMLHAYLRVAPVRSGTILDFGDVAEVNLGSGEIVKYHPAFRN